MLLRLQILEDKHLKIILKLKVVKNTLLQKAMEQIEGVDYSGNVPNFQREYCFNDCRNC